jgi:hypothetical protein
MPLGSRAAFPALLMRKFVIGPKECTGVPRPEVGVMPNRLKNVRRQGLQMGMAPSTGVEPPQCLPPKVVGLLMRDGYQSYCLRRPLGFRLQPAGASRGTNDYQIVG